MSNDRPRRHRLYCVNRWLYRGDRPGAIARSVNPLWVQQFAAGRMSRPRDMTLEVHGRRTGQVIALPVVMPDYSGARFFVSMLGDNANWVKNMRASKGRAVLQRRGSQHIQLEEVPTPHRAPEWRLHLPVDRSALFCLP
jgi:hypothetical protein